MVLEHGYGWGYETLMREVSDSLQLRRLCLVAIDEAVPTASAERTRTGWAVFAHNADTHRRYA